MKRLEIWGEHLIEETEEFFELVIHDQGKLTAPKGKFVTLSVNGNGRDSIPGIYRGDIVLSVTEEHHMKPHGLMRMKGKSEEFHSAAVVESNKIFKSSCVPALLVGGQVQPDKMEGVTISSDEPSFNGLLITGTSTYHVKDCRFMLDGPGHNDFMGVGAAVTAIDNTHVLIEDCDFTMAGVTRCAIHVAGESVVDVKNCRIENHSPEDLEWLGDFSWGIGVTGTNRLVQLADNGTVTYDNCDMKTNGWGICSIDGCDDCAKVFIKNSRLELSGPRANGYGAFCIGDRNVVSFDHSKVHVDGYALLVRGMLPGAARAEIVNGCEVTGNRFAILSIGDNDTPVTLADSSFVTGKSTLTVKGSSTRFLIKNCTMTPGNGTILQLMDNDEAGMDVVAVKVPNNRTDQYEEGRALDSITAGRDVQITFEDMTAIGNLFNSTTNLHMERECSKVRTKPRTAFGGLLAPPEGSDTWMNTAPPATDDEFEAMTYDNDYDRDFRGAKNLAVNLINTRIEGILSSAEQRYREGLEWIDETSRLELSNITQYAAPTINNGVVVTVDTNSTWVVTGTSYITGLSLGEYALVKAPAGKKLSVTVDGKEIQLSQGQSYRGKIVLSVQ